MDRNEILTYASKQMALLIELGKRKQVSIDDGKIYELVLEWIEENEKCTLQDVKEFLGNIRMILETEIEIRTTELQTNCIWLTK